MLNDKLFFSVEDISKERRISIGSSRVYLSRKIKKGDFLRVKRDFYIKTERFSNMGLEEFFYISNFLQSPSYISLMTALNFYDMTLQVPRIIENICIYRTKIYTVKDFEFKYYKINRKLFFGYIREGSFFIATKEKAFFDMLYLASFGKYQFSISEINLDRFDKKILINLEKKYPEKTKQFFRKIWKNL